MKGNTGNMKALSYQPAERDIDTVDDLYHADPDTADPYMLTSIKIRTSLRNRIKAKAGIEGIRMQDLIAMALDEYLERNP